MSQNNLKLTSVELDEELLSSFKVRCIGDKFSLQKLVSRSIFLYLTDKEFRDRILNQINIKLKNDE